MAVNVSQSQDPKAPKNLFEEVQALLNQDLHQLGQSDIEDLIETVLAFKDDRIPAEVDRLNTAANTIERFPDERRSVCEMRHEAASLKGKINDLSALWRRLNHRWGELEREKKRRAS